MSVGQRLASQCLSVGQRLTSHWLQAQTFGRYMNEKVVEPTKQKVKEGHLWDDMKTSASGLAAKVRTVTDIPYSG